MQSLYNGHFCHPTHSNKINITDIAVSETFHFATLGFILIISFVRPVYSTHYINNSYSNKIMENFTHFNDSFFTFRLGIWINDFVFICILLMVSLYLFVALVYHNTKVDKPLDTKFFRLMLEKKFVYCPNTYAF